MPAITLIFPHQLFKDHPDLQPRRDVFLVEEWLFFRQYSFHQQKLVLHRASMKFYEEYLLKKNYKVHYVETHVPENDCRILIQSLAAKGVTEIYTTDPADDWLRKRMVSACEKNKIRLYISASPGFLNTIKSARGFLDKRKTYFQTDFYIWQRKERKLLLDANGKPLGGKWTFDAENRKKYPKKSDPPRLHLPGDNKYLQEARAYVPAHFSHNYGQAESTHLFAVTFEEAEKWLDDFLQHRFADFGIYEDAIVAQEAVLHHSLLTPLLNTGLITPQQVLDKTLQAASQYAVPLNSLEGFIRQITGWREFIRLVYEREGGKQRTRNYWGFHRKIPASFWTGQTGIAPVDITVHKILQSGYCHHIERLMVLGNFMLLCEFDPDEVYRWFMELFIDAYDWVMVPNVYGMTQFADGGLMTTKPYISGSNYLMKMSDYPKGDWQQIWDALFWRFMHRHRHFFSQNPRLGMLLNTFDKMSPDKQTSLLSKAENYLQSLDVIS